MYEPIKRHVGFLALLIPVAVLPACGARSSQPQEGREPVSGEDPMMGDFTERVTDSGVQSVEDPAGKSSTPTPIAQDSAAGGSTAVFEPDAQECAESECEGSAGCGGSGLCPGKLQVAAGEGETCVVFEDGNARCWNEMMKDASEAPIIALEEPIVQFAAGSGHRCVLLLSGKLRCTGDKWGFGPTVREDQYTDLYQAVPEFPDDVGVLQVGVSRWSTCALKRNGKVQCVGDNSEGIWGFGMEAEPTGGDIPFATPVKHIAVGVGHACALESSGEVRCWGGGGNEGYVVPAVDRPVIELDGEVVQLSAGNSHTCALLKDGRVQCWGDFRGPSLRSAPNTSFTDGLFELTTVDLGGSAVQIASGEQHACAVLATSAVRCWGSNGAGQLGYGLEVDGVYMMQHSNLPADAPTPASMGDVAVGGNVVQLTSKHNHTCALLDDDRLRCWSNYPVALGYADKEPRPVPRDDVPYR